MDIVRVSQAHAVDEHNYTVAWPLSLKTTHLWYVLQAKLYRRLAYSHFITYT